MNDLDKNFILRTLELARNGGVAVRPNPLVGAILVHDQKEVSGGYHQRYGGSHAEVSAIENLSDRTLLPKCTLYVNLEPCAHFGKTPPCAKRIVEEGIREVVFGGFDPNPKVSGRGLAILESAGVKVRHGVLVDRCVDLNKRFYTSQVFKRPYVILKWAETADRFIARTDGTSRWISSVESRATTHQWRAEEDAVLVGTNTALIDNPELTVRHVEGRNPIRVVLDLKQRLPTNLKLFDGTAQTIRITAADLKGGSAALFQILNGLLSQGVQSVIVEGGAKTLNWFLEENLWDELRVFSSKENFGAGVRAPELPISGLIEESEFGADRLKLYLHHENRQRLIASGLSKF